MNSGPFDLLLILPSLRISGGVQEALLLAEQLTRHGVSVRVLSLWKADNELPHPHLPADYLSHSTPRKIFAAVQYPFLLIKFIYYLCKNTVERRPALMLTHFSTFPFSWLAPSYRWYCFNQDIEWMFVPDGLGRLLLRRFILATCRRSQVINTNSFIESQYAQEGIESVAQMTIWADEFWTSGESVPDRPIDVVLLLRRGRMKRLDLYLDILPQLRQRNIRCATVTPDPELHSLVQHRVEHAFLRPTNQEMRDLYKQSKIFLSLSDTEGFGLTPLEAMGQGCVPVCRDSGGVRCYMRDSLLPNLIARSEPLETIINRVKDLLASPNQLEVISKAAVDTFRNGVKESVMGRNKAIIILAQRLKLGPA
jgi:glycosyltransferase involved in cell wall biosynthesis